MTQPEEGKIIDTRPPWLKGIQAEGTTLGTLTVDGKNIPYTIVRKGLTSDLPYALGHNGRDGKHLFISLEAPEEYRPFIMAHEIRHEESFPELPEAEKCKAAIGRELEDVRKDLPGKYDDYVSQRATFFDALVLFYENNPEQLAAKPAGFLEGIKSARSFLHSATNN